MGPTGRGQAYAGGKRVDAGRNPGDVGTADRIKVADQLKSRGGPLAFPRSAVRTHGEVPDPTIPVVVPRKDETATREELLAFLEGKIANWWIPDDVAFVDEIPHTSTGKIQKTALRERFKDYVFPTAAAS